MWYYMYPETRTVQDLPYYLYSIGQHELQPRITKPNGHDSDQFFFNLKGDGVLILHGHEYELPAGCGFFIPAGIPHEYYPKGSYWDIRWMSPRGESLPALYRKLGLREGVHHLHSCARLDHLLYKMREALLNDPTYGIFYASSLVLEYVVEFAKQSALLTDAPQSGTSPKAQKEGVYRKHMNAISDYVNYHYMNKITDDELCSLIGVTAQHLCRIIRACTGMSPTEYVNHIRIRKAKEYLRNTNFTASEIACYCGYPNNNYFWRIFKKETRLSPGEYRKQYQLHSEIGAGTSG